MELCVRICEHIWNELKAEEDEIATDKVLIFQIEKKSAVNWDTNSIFTKLACQSTPRLTCMSIRT